jgi:hypothetical protein
MKTTRMQTTDAVGRAQTGTTATTDLGHYRHVLLPGFRCAAQVLRLMARHRLQIRNGNVGKPVRLPDSREFVVFRETTCDGGDLEGTVTLAVWFHLRGVPGGARLRRFLFERESILNTILYAGFAGYRVKLWMVDPVTSDYAGLYAWRDRESASAYARYIATVLRPLSRPGSVGYEIVEVRLDEHLAATSSPVQLAPAGSLTQGARTALRAPEEDTST